MTRPANSCHRLQDRSATGVLLMLLLLSVVSVDAYKGVGTRNRGLSFHCEVRVNHEVKFWVGTYRTEALAALACDVAFFYTNRASEEFNFEYSEDVISSDCKPRSAYDSLNDWKEREKFIKAEANALINLMSPQNQAPDFRWEDVTVPPLVRVRQRSGSGNVAWTITGHFRNQAEQLREFMAWLMRLSNAATQLTHKSEETKSQLDIEGALPVGGDQFLDAARVTLLLDSVEARPGGAPWLTHIASILPLLFQIFAIIKDIKDASNINANDASVTEQERCQSTAKRSTKRQKVNQPSSFIELVPDQEDLSTASLRPFSFFPDLDSNLSKRHSICRRNSLVCVNNSVLGAELVVSNLLTVKASKLPPLLFPRHPVLLHMLVDSATNSYRVIVAGSSSSGEEHLSKKMEVFDSKTSEWEEMCDIPGPAFGLNEYQEGVCANGILYFISFLEGDGGKGVVAFDVENKKWLPNMTCPIPYSCSWSTLQLIESNGEVYLVYEQLGKHCFDLLELSNSASAEVSCHWRTVVPVKSGRGLEMYPEYNQYMRGGFGEGSLCTFNNTERAGAVVSDEPGGKVSKASVSPRDQSSSNFFSLNPAALTLDPEDDLYA